MAEEVIHAAAIQALVRNKHIRVLGCRTHAKASEKYVDVIFEYPQDKLKWEGAVPIEYRRTGIYAKTEQEIAELLEKTYASKHPQHKEHWLKEGKAFWDAANKKITRAFFEALKDGKWKCVYCQLPPNPNWARRVQDLKEFGYTLSTDTKRFCKNCKRNTTQLIMLHIPRGSRTGYETWSPALRKKILTVLDNFDVYENRKATALLPDHKFPEIRWDEKTKQENPDDMSEEEIKRKFQLLSNQRNEQKREVCRNCFQTGKRGKPFDIPFFHEGDENWPKNVPQRGKGAEKGCHGCGWYDLKAWREALEKRIAKK
jgi:hypothetical protein